MVYDDEDSDPLCGSHLRRRTPNYGVITEIIHARLIATDFFEIAADCLA